MGIIRDYLFFIKDFKLDVMTKEILKLRTILNDLKKNRNQLETLAGNNKTKSNCSVCLDLIMHLIQILMLS